MTSHGRREHRGTITIRLSTAKLQASGEPRGTPRAHLARGGCGSAPWWRFRGLGADSLRIRRTQGFDASRRAPLRVCGCRSRAARRTTLEGRRVRHAPARAHAIRWAARGPLRPWRSPGSLGGLLRYSLASVDSRYTRPAAGSPRLTAAPHATATAIAIRPTDLGDIATPRSGSSLKSDRTTRGGHRSSGGARGSWMSWARRGSEGGCGRSRRVRSRCSRPNGRPPLCTGSRRTTPA